MSVVQQRTDASRAVPECSEAIEIPHLKARTGSYAIQHWAHDTMTLEKTFEKRDTLNQAVVRTVKGTATAWSIQYEIREIISPASIKQAMGMQAEAERRKREEIL